MTSTLEIAGTSRAGGLRLAASDLAALPSSAQVADVGTLIAGRKGRAVRLAAIVDLARPSSATRHLNITSRDPAFAVSVPLDEVRDRALVVYELDGLPLDPAKGGPFRLLVCGHPDECVNVKELVRLEFSDRPGRDTRPKDDAEHQALHRKAKH